MSNHQAKSDPQLRKGARGGGGGGGVYRASSSKTGGGHGGSGTSRPVAPGSSGGGNRRKPNGHSSWQPSNAGNGDTRSGPAPPGRGPPTSKQPPPPQETIPPQDAGRSPAPAPVTFQFGSFVVPARTSSAPPNLDEQKREQAQYEARAAAAALVPNMPIPQHPQHVEHHMHQQIRHPMTYMPPGMQPPVLPHTIVQPGFTQPPKFQPPPPPAQVPQQIPQPQYSPIFQPRSSKAIKIVNPETQEEVRFDNKRNMVDGPPVLPSGPMRGMIPHQGRPTMYGGGPHVHYPPPPPQTVPMGTPFFPQGSVEGQRYAYGMQAPYTPPRGPPPAPAPAPAQAPAPRVPEQPIVIGTSPTVAADTISVPRVETPTVAAETISVPRVETPTVAADTISVPRVETPTVAADTISVPRVETAPVAPRVPVDVETNPAVTPLVDATGPRVDVPQVDTRRADGATTVTEPAAIEPIVEPVDAPAKVDTKVEAVIQHVSEAPAPAPAETSDVVSDAAVDEPQVTDPVPEADPTSRESDVVGSGDEKQPIVASEGSDRESSAAKPELGDKKDHSPEAVVKTSGNKKKNKKKLLAKADAAGSTSDLYNAYKSIDEKKEEVKPSEHEEAAEQTVEVPEVQESGPNEPEDWEDAADLPTPTPRTDDHLRYTRDFLLTFKDQHTELPSDFEFKPEIVDCLMNVKQVWAKPTSSRHQDIRVDLGVPPGGFRPSMPSPGMRYPHPPMMGPGYNPHMRGVEADRWGHRGLIPAPHPSLPAIHKAENKYEIGKVSGEEEIKQRQINAILNKLTPQNFEKLFGQVVELGVDTPVTLTGVISQIFEKAVMEPTFCETYARFCVQLSVNMPEFTEDGEKVTFRRVLLNKCQEEFERGKREEEEAGKVEEGEETSPEKREQKRVKARRRMLGNIRFIGELYKNSMLTERIMHECIKTLLGEYQNPDEEDVEALCRLMTTIGQLIDHQKAKAHMDAYFERMAGLSNNPKLSSRMRFGLKDVIDLRRNGWQQRRKVEGPKKIEEVHRDAIQERNQNSRDSRHSRGGSMRNSRYPPSPGSAMGGPRGMPNRMHQDFRQDHRMEEPYVMPMTVPQRPDEISLVPQGSLGRGPGRAGSFSAGPSSLEGRRPGTAPSRGGPAAPYRDEFSASRPGFVPERPILDRPSTAEQRLERPSTAERLERPTSGGGRPLERSTSDRIAAYSDRPVTPPTPPVIQAPPPLSEDQLKSKSDLAIREYYSARDLKEVAQCVEELRNPDFHPEMISRWVGDSLERKEMERDLLVKLLMQLNSSEPSLLTRDHLRQGFETVFSTFEDMVMDVPRAPEYVGSILGKLVAQNIFQLVDAGRLVKDAGSPKGSLLEGPDGVNVFASILDSLRKEKGEDAMVQAYASSKLNIEEFMAEREPEVVETLLKRKNLVCLNPTLPAAAYIRDALANNQSIPEMIEWLQGNASGLFTDAAFQRMVMTEILKHSTRSSGDMTWSSGRITDYSGLLKKVGKSPTGQMQYLLAVQLFAHLHNHPPGFMKPLFQDLYQSEIVEEQTFFRWKDDLKNPTPGKAQAIREVGMWFTWLETAPEEGDE